MATLAKLFDFVYIYRMLVDTQKNMWHKTIRIYLITYAFRDAIWLASNQASKKKKMYNFCSLIEYKVHNILVVLTLQESPQTHYWSGDTLFARMIVFGLFFFNIKMKTGM